MGTRPPGFEPGSLATPVFKTGAIPDYATAAYRLLEGNFYIKVI
jgi:hypothetical protein